MPIRPAMRTWRVVENIRTILVPVDFSQASLAAFETALLLHAHPGTTVVVQHVIEAGHVEYIVELGYGMPDEIRTKARVHAERQIRRLTDVDLPEGVEVERVVAIGRPPYEILRLAAELAADLIVLGAHPPDPSPERALVGSTAERVLRRARCPVLVIPGPAGEPEIEPPGRDVASGAPSTT